MRSGWSCTPAWGRGLPARGVPLGTGFFFVKDRPKGPPQKTTNCQPPTATNHQPPPTANRQPLAATNPQLPTATNHQSPTTNRQTPTANRQLPPTMVEYMSYTRSFYKTAVQKHFFFLLTTPLVPA